MRRAIGREVSIADRAFGFGQVFQRVVERRDVRFQSRFLERTETTAEAGQTGDNFIDDPGCGLGVSLEIASTTRAEFVQLAADPAEGCRANTLDAKTSLLVADDIRTDLEVRSAASNRKAKLISIDQGAVNREAEVKRARVE